MRTATKGPSHSTTVCKGSLECHFDLENTPSVFQRYPGYSEVAAHFSVSRGHSGILKDLYVIVTTALLYLLFSNHPRRLYHHVRYIYLSKWHYLNPPRFNIDRATFKCLIILHENNAFKMTSKITESLHHDTFNSSWRRRKLEDVEK